MKQLSNTALSNNNNHGYFVPIGLLLKLINCLSDYKAALELQRKQAMQKKILTLEEGFNRIKAATHVNDLDEVLFISIVKLTLYQEHTTLWQKAKLKGV